MKVRILAVLLALPLTVVPLGAQELQLEEVVTFTSIDMVARPRAMVIGDTMIAVAELGASDFGLFDLRGREISRLGRRGRGPGEFMSIFSLAEGRGGPAVWDMGNWRIVEYGADLRPATTSFRMVASDVAQMGDRWLLAGTNPIHVGEEILFLGSEGGGEVTPFGEPMPLSPMFEGTQNRPGLVAVGDAVVYAVDPITYQVQQIAWPTGDVTGRWAGELGGVEQETEASARLSAVVVGAWVDLGGHLVTVVSRSTRRYDALPEGDHPAQTAGPDESELAFHLWSSQGELLAEEIVPSPGVTQGAGRGWVARGTERPNGELALTLFRVRFIN